MLALLLSQVLMERLTSLVCFSGLHSSLTTLAQQISRTVHLVLLFTIYLYTQALITVRVLNVHGYFKERYDTISLLFLT